jgi:hypothetical protein
VLPAIDLRALVLSLGNHRDKGLVGPALFELYSAIGEGKKGVILPYPHIPARVVPGAPLPDDNVAGDHLLASKNLDSKPFALRLPAVLYLTFALLVCHLKTLFGLLGLLTYC